MQGVKLMNMQTIPAVDQAGAPTLVYDGECGFCNRSVQFILRHERRRDLLFVPRDSELGRRLRRSHGLDAVESMLWIEGDRVFTESASVIKATEYLGGWWSRLGRVASLCPPPLLNLMYRAMARSRRKLMRGSPNCAVPTPEQRSRFLD